MALTLFFYSQLPQFRHFERSATKPRNLSLDRSNLSIGVTPTRILIDFLIYRTVLPRLAAAEGLLLFGVKKNQKTPAENFSLKASK